MAHYLNPKNDLAFKHVFGANKRLCISLINSMLPLKSPIISIEYQSGELVPELDILRNAIVDVRCTDAEGRQFLVEMQLQWSELFKKRVLFNASRAYVTQRKKGQEIKLLKPVYSLNFVDENFEKSPEKKNEYYHHYKIVNIEDTGKQIEGLEFIFIELPKFKPQNRAEMKLHELWLRFLTEINEDTKEIPEELMENEDIREAISYMETRAFSLEQLDAYYQRMIDEWTVRGMFEEAEEKGIKRGIEKGIEQGKQEKTIIIARNLLKKGMSQDDISDATGLTLTEINKLIIQLE